MGQWKFNSMHGYGEFFWKDGKKYIGSIFLILKGYYVKDKKEGFGIYFWANPTRSYIGFWKDGKQDGVGKYVTQNKTKFGFWENGVRQKWYKTEKDAMNDLGFSQLKFVKLFSSDIDSVTEFLSR